MLLNNPSVIANASNNANANTNSGNQNKAATILANTNLLLNKHLPVSPNTLNNINNNNANNFTNSMI